MKQEKDETDVAGRNETRRKARQILTQTGRNSDLYGSDSRGSTGYKSHAQTTKGTTGKNNWQEWQYPMTVPSS